MREHHLIAVAFVIHVISIACEKPTSIIIINAHLWLTATPCIRDIWENTRGLLIKIKQALGWVKVKVVVADKQLHGELVVYIIDWIQLLLGLNELIINLQRHWYLMILYFFLPTLFCRRSLLVDRFILGKLFYLIDSLSFLGLVISVDLLIIPYFIFVSHKIVPCLLIFAKMSPRRVDSAVDLGTGPLRVFFL